MSFQKAILNCERCYNVSINMKRSRDHDLDFFHDDIIRNDQIYNARNEAMKAIEDEMKNIEDKVRKPWDYGFSDTTNEMLSLLDEERYGSATQPQSCEPALGDPKKMKQVDIGDKVSMDFNYSIGGAEKQQISNPIYFNKIIMGGGSHEDNDGRYPVELIFPQDIFKIGEQSLNDCINCKFEKPLIANYLRIKMGL